MTEEHPLIVATALTLPADWVHKNWPDSPFLKSRPRAQLLLFPTRPVQSSPSIQPQIFLCTNTTMHPSTLLLPLFSLLALASFNKARATGAYKCALTGPNLTINHETVPLPDYILSLLSAYGKHTSTATAAFDALRYASLEDIDVQDNTEPLPHKASYSSVLVLLRTAKERAFKLEEQLRCFDDALGAGDMYERSEGRLAMKKVVQVVGEEVQGTREMLGRKKRALREALKRE